MIETIRVTPLGPTTYASFPWYDLPEMRRATDAFWEALRGKLVARGMRDVPSHLDRTREHGTDRAGTCLFTQTCGLPLFTTARDHFAVLGAPAYRVPHAVGATHRSYIVVRADADVRTLEDLRGARFAINEADSNSGMNLPRRLFAPLARDGHFFASATIVGSHAASAAAVAASSVDAVAIDCVTFALLARYRPSALADLRVVGLTASTPTPPFVTSRHTSPADRATLRLALRDLVVDPTLAEVRDALMLVDLESCDASAYEVVLRFEDEARALGYPILA